MAQTGGQGGGVLPSDAGVPLVGGAGGTTPVPMDAAVAPTNDAAADSLTGANAAPSVNAGANKSAYTLSGGVDLTGVVMDDGLPAGSPLTLSWSKASGPGTATFAPSTAAKTKVTFSEAGTYVLRLTANDGALSGQGELTVTVMALDLNLVGHWRFDEGTGSSAADSSGGNNPAVFMNGATWADGRIGKALNVGNGNTDHARVTDPLNGRFAFGTNDFTIALWVKTSQVPPAGSFPELMHKFDGAFEVRTGIEILNVLNNQMQPRSTYKLMTAGKKHGIDIPILADNNWHHFVARKSAMTLEIIVDGTVRAKTGHTAGSITTDAPIVFGGDDACCSLDGLLDDARIYMRQLSDAEIAVLANGQSP